MMPYTVVMLGRLDPASSSSGSCSASRSGPGTRSSSSGAEPAAPRMSDIAICYAILAGVVVLFVWGRLPVELVAIGVALSLWATGVLDARAGARRASATRR